MPGRRSGRTGSSPDSRASVSGRPRAADARSLGDYLGVPMNGARIPLRSACRGKPRVPVNGAGKYRWVPFVARVLRWGPTLAGPPTGSYFSGSPLGVWVLP
jgi:hypothetical protein